MANRWDGLSTQDKVTELYVATLGRAPDKGGLAYWVGQVDSGAMTLAQVEASFFTQPEVQAKYPSGTTSTAFVTAVYQNAFGRVPDTAGLTYWVGELDAGRVTRADFILSFLTGAYDDATAGTHDSSLLTNLHIAAEFFAATAPDFPWNGTSAEKANFFATADSVLNGVTGDPATGAASVAASEALAKAFVAGGLSGFALTSSGSVVEGSALTFTLTAVASSTADQTFNLSIVGDTLGGAAAAATPGTDLAGAPTSVTLPAGQTSVTFKITPTVDNAAEGTEGFKVSVLSGATAVASTTALITDAPADTQAPVVTASQVVNYAEGTAASVVLGTVAATDNVGVTGFAIASGNSDGFFAINSKGEVTLTAAGAAATSPAESAAIQPNTFTLGITATDAAGNTSTATSVTLNVQDQTPPVAATKATLGGSTITLSYNETLDSASLPAAGSFTVLQNGTTSIAVSTVTVSGSSLILGLAAAPSGTITLSYTPPATNPLQDKAGNDAVAFTAKAVDTDTAAPTLLVSSSTPTDNATNVAVADNIVLTFSETVQAGTGEIKLVSLNGTDNRTFSITDSQVTITGNTVTINPTTDLAAGLDYSIQMASGVVKDASGNAFAGITNATTLNFTTAQPVLTDLTSGSDIVSGNTFDGTLDILSGQSVETLTSGDRLTGTGVNPTLNVQVQQYVHTVTPLNMTGIQTVNVDASTLLPASTTAGIPTFNFANVDTSVKNFSLSGQTQDFFLTNIAAVIGAFGVSNVGLEAAGDRADFTATFQSKALSGTSDSTTLTLNGLTPSVGDIVSVITLEPALAGSGFETITVNSTGGTPNAVVLTDGLGNSLTTLNVTGTQNLATVTTDTTLTKVDASTFTGNLGYTAAAANGQNMTVTGGTANDVIDVSGYTTGDVINGGLGTDRLVLTNAEAVAATTVQSNVSGIEVIGLSTGLAGTVTLANFGATGLRFGAVMTAAGTVVAPAGTSSLDLQTFASGGFALTDTVAGVATTDVVNMTLGSTTAGNTFGAGAVTFNGAETVDLLVQGGAGSFGSTFALTDTAATETLNITGIQNLTFTGAITANVINASTFTGSLTMGAATVSTAGATITGGSGADTLRGTAVADIISGGDGNDTITGAAGADILSGGAGADSFIYTTVTDCGTIATGPLDSISGLVLGSTGTFDTLDITATGTLAVRNAGVAYTGTINAATLAADLVAGVGLPAGAANSQGYLITATAGDQVGRTFLVVDINDDGALTAADIAIVVTGVSGALTTANFV